MLSIEELQNIIDQFDQEELARKGVLCISQDGTGPGQCFIRANKEGLEIFALKLLQAAKESEAVLLSKEKNIIPFNTDELWLDENSDVVIQYVEPIAEKRLMKSEPKSKSFFSEKLMPYGCGLVVLILIVSCVVGFFTLLKWTF